MTRAAERIGTVLLLLAWAFPLYWMLVASLTPESRLFGVPQMVPHSLGLEHYRALFGERQFWLPIRNSLIVAGATTVFAVLPWRAVRLCHGPHAVPREILAAGDRDGGLDVSPDFRGLAAVSPAATHRAHRHVSRSRPSLSDVRDAVGNLADERLSPRACHGRSKTPRVSTVRALFERSSRSRCALAAPALATTAILTFLYAWNEFLFALSFTLGPERQTVPVALALFRGRYQVPWGQILAGSVVASLPVAVVVLAFQRRIVKGLTAGAVKG